MIIIINGNLELSSKFERAAGDVLPVLHEGENKRAGLRARERGEIRTVTWPRGRAIKQTKIKIPCLYSINSETSVLIQDTQMKQLSQVASRNANN